MDRPGRLSMERGYHVAAGGLFLWHLTDYVKKTISFETYNNRGMKNHVKNN